MHLYRTFACPILRKIQLEPLGFFQRKCRKTFLQLLENAPTPAIHFLTGELTVEGKIHRDISALFCSLWTNPSFKVFQVEKYLLEISSPNSRTWSVHLRNISEMYGIEDPFNCLERTPPSKESYKKRYFNKNHRIS